MNSRRMAKASEAIRETVSTVILFELRDPRIKNVTVISADVSPDLRASKIYVSVMGDAKAQSLAMHGLDSARGFIQSKIADRLQTKNTPIIRFVLDPSVKKSIEVSRALQEAQQQDVAAANPDGTDSGHADEDVDELEEDHPDSASEESRLDTSTGT
ncbi:MAG: 30S ribosome-binding factor RbfA [Planctomycetes bacterium]|nr:30S ribosome-binding factor RbfA [Planctomycetota bacterium]